MIYEVHRKVKDNVGDHFCNPSRYFNFQNCISGELLYNNFPIENQTLIIGGGGLIHKKFSQHIQTLIQKKPKNIILWGIGHNFSKKYEHKNAQAYYPKWINDASLIGIRDWIKGYEHFYLPCVSCMHPAFDTTYETKHELVYYTHAFKSKYQHSSGDVWLKNDEKDFNKVIEFLGSAKTVVTDSYHGAYWAQLLKKDVRVLSWSVKFNHMKYSPSFLADIKDWASSSPSYADSDFLSECRSLNKEFYKKTLTVISE